MTVVFFVVLEGLSGTALFLHDIVRYSRSPLAERAHSRYDPLLGWTNLPNVELRDLYGPGLHFTTNSQGFRNVSDFEVNVPPGRLRVLCSGDSFTLGYGVGDEAPWCQLLRSLDPRLETVNMGQGGYGLDQSYLWYLRDGRKLRHDVVLFSFITEDFFRIGHDNFLGYGKPVLEPKGDRLIATGVPVPRRSYYFPWVTQNAALFRRLRSLELYERLRLWMLPSRSPSAEPDIGRILEVASKIFQDLDRAVREQGGVLVLVYLPVSQDYSGSGSNPWREFTRLDSERRGIPYLDLVEEYRKLSEGEAGRIFKDHYSVEGNRFVAKAVHSKLLSLPAVASRISRLQENRPEP